MATLTLTPISVLEDVVLEALPSQQAQQPQAMAAFEALPSQQAQQPQATAVVVQCRERLPVAVPLLEAPVVWGVAVWMWAVVGQRRERSPAVSAVLALLPAGLMQSMVRMMVRLGTLLVAARLGLPVRLALVGRVAVTAELVM